MKGMVTVAAGKTVAVRQEAAMKTGETPVAGTTGPSAAPVVVKAQAAAPSGDMTDGEVRKVDKDNKKITLKHGEIKSLDMPPMTMVFQVNDAAMLDQVKAGDKVRFKASNEGGKMIVTEMQPAR